MARETTPIKITQAIMDMCASITSSSTPVFVTVQPKPWALPHECFNNVQQMIRQNSGTMISGWAIWQWGNILLDAEVHAIWQSPDGDFTDITPHNYSETRIFFLPDASVNYKEVPIRSHRKALTGSALVAELIHLYSKRDDIMCSSAAGNTYALPVAMVLRINQIQTLLHQKAGRNDPCPCGSGLKYKKCCGLFE